jgi:hypothetical protein
MPLQRFYHDISLMEVTSLTQLIAYTLLSEMISVVTHVFVRTKRILFFKRLTNYILSCSLCCEQRNVRPHKFP